MKKCFAAALLALLAFAASAQVKNYVGVVREVHYPSYDEFLSDLSSDLKGKGYSTYAEYVDAYKQGGFGSGFVYVAPDGTNYVVTNRHVVSEAASATVEFENDDGSWTKYQGLSILITDDDIDLAILRFEGGANTFKRGLSFYGKKVLDGQDVASAGFPGLGGEPVWQFGRGSVTNAAARIKDLIDPSISTVIQHSAQIDAGNSGGPLLAASSASALGYEVAGINTWKAVGRDSTNFAIPSALALQLIEKSKRPSDDAAALLERKQKFQAAVQDGAGDWTGVIKFISYDYAAKNGPELFEDILRHAPTKVRERAVQEFARSPIEGLRCSAAYSLFGDFSGENATEENLQKIEWQKESGLYRIASVQEEKKRSKQKASSQKSSKKESGSKSSSSSSKKRGVPSVSWLGFESPYSLAFHVGAVFPVKSEADLGTGLDIAVSVFPGSLGSFGVFVEYERAGVGGAGFNAFGGGGAVRLPINFDLFCLCPKADAGLKVGFGDARIFEFFADLGLETVFNLGIDYIRPGFEVGWRFLSDSFYGASGADFHATSSAILARLTLGISFD